MTENDRGATLNIVETVEPTASKDKDKNKQSSPEELRERLGRLENKLTAIERTSKAPAATGQRNRARPSKTRTHVQTRGRSAVNAANATMPKPH